MGLLQALLRDKFRRHKDLRVLLSGTSPKELVYENDHNDSFWGVCKGKGSNHLGQLLMKVRQDERDGLDTQRWARTVFATLPDDKVRKREAHGGRAGW